MEITDCAAGQQILVHNPQAGWTPYVEAYVVENLTSKKMIKLKFKTNGGGYGENETVWFSYDSLRYWSLIHTFAGYEDDTILFS